MKRYKKILSGILVGALLVSLAGCGSAVASSDKAATGSSDSDSTTIEAGANELVVGWTEIIDQPFNPAQVTNTWSDQAAPIFDALITMDGNGNYSPGLATEWELSDDKLSFTLKLREGVTFHDGSDFTSEDVKFTLEYYASDESNQADKSVLQEYIASIDTPDDYTVVLNFTKPCAEFEYLLSSNGTGTGLILPSDYFQEVGEEEFGINPIGTGPFKLESFSAGNEIVYTANEDYWNGAPSYDRLVLKEYSEESTRVAELQAGNIDFAPISDISASIFDNYDNIRIEQDNYSTTLGLFIAGIDQDTGAALQDVRVREALSLAINREELVDAVFEGDATAAGVWGLYPFTYGYDGSRDEAAEYNPEKAKELLEEAGYPDAFSQPVIQFYVSSAGTTYLDDTAQALVAYWQAVGIQAEIVPVDRVELSSLRSAKPISEDFAGSIYFFNPPKKFSAYDAFAAFYPSTSSLGLIQGDDELDQDIAEIISLYGEERESMVSEVLDIIEEYQVSIPLVYTGQSYAVSDKVASFDATSSGHVGNWFYTFELN